MNTSQKFQRAIATFFLLIFLPTLVPANLYANNNGPVAPEAASFEPVDATDMVNLATGDMSYVMPLINVPGPEGGYPLALSYHAGIAMEQEASWVGLGWTLNPGAINRSVKGVPDDWFNKKTSDFFYDQGDTVDSFNFSIGGTFPSGMTVGLGASWGSHQAFGGYVSIGYLGAVSASIGTNGYWNVNAGGIGVGSNSASMNLGVLAVTYGPLTLGLNYDAFKGDFSVGLSVGGTVGGSDSKAKASVGISFESNQVGSSNVSNSNNVNTTNQGQYDVKVSNYQTGLNLGLFWFGYGHRRVEYSLFNTNNFNEVGSLYPESHKISASYESLITTSGGLFAPKLLGSYKMDIHRESLAIYSAGNPEDVGGVVGEAVYSSYDNYIVDSQGISGQIMPGTLDEQAVTRAGLFTDPNMDASNVLGNKINFKFINSNTSFLRTGKGDFSSYAPSSDPYNAINQTVYNNLKDILFSGNFSTIQRAGNNYSQNTTPSGEVIKSGNKLREGNYVEVFTNEQIIAGSVADFVEAKGINRTTDNEFASEPKGIGAYRVTALDGKTYHYSLPVYQYETHFKSFNDNQNENSRFYESTEDCQYATHWLLTAVTGPDYVDSNMNGQVDSQDYGYWTEFQYGKWSDGYMWRSPHTGYKTMPGANAYVDATYSYYWGRKQVYYLDAVKTRTHTALFVKKMREDDCSSVFSVYNSKINSPANFNRNVCKVTATQRTNLQFAKKGDVLYSSAGQQYVVVNNKLKGKRTKFVYVDAPKNFSLALDKILIVKNDVASTINKSNGALTSNSEGYSYEGYGYTNVTSYLENDSLITSVQDLFSDTGTDRLRYFKSNLHQNILDVKDVEGLNLETKSSKTIQFDYSYELAKQTVNSFSPTKGRLTLDKVSFLDKENHSFMPPYRFEYFDAAQNYNKADEDEWGYHKTNPKIWSLSKIVAPTGGVIDVEYESDSYRRQAVVDNDEIGGNVINRPLIYNRKSYETFSSSTNGLPTLTKNNGKIYITTNTFYSNSLDKISEQYYKTKELYLNYLQGGKWYYDVYEIESFEIINVGGTNYKVQLVLKQTEDTQFYNIFTDEFYPVDYNLSGIYTDPNPRLVDVSLIVPTDSYTSIDDGVSTTENYTSNGKLGGGIRVKTISVSDRNSANSISKEKYSYINPYSNKISGITSYTPYDKNKFIPMLSFLPSPDVNYEFVTVTRTNGNNDVISKQVFEFNVLKPVHKLGVNGGNGNSASSTTYGNSLTYRVKAGSFGNYKDQNNNTLTLNYFNGYVKKKMGLLGTLKSLKVFNVKDQLMYQKTNHFKRELDQDGQIGVKESSYVSAGGHSLNGNNSTIYSLSVLEYPSLMDWTKEQGGNTTSTTYFDKYDFLTGKVLETRKETSDGKIFKTKIVPAYTKYGALGSKVDNVNNRNMLSQTAAEYSYIYDPADANKPWKETGVGITTWSNEWTYQDIQGNLVTPTADKEKIWRKHKTYTWNGIKDNNGIFQNYNSATDDGFDWTVGVGSQPANWKQISEVTKYDHYSMTLEAKDINHNHAATKMGDKETKITAVGNAKYNELYYSGLENISSDGIWLEPGINLNGATRDITKSHSGKYSLAVNSPGKLNIDLKDNQHKAGRYKLNVWVHKDNAGYARLLINGVAVTNSFNGPSKQAGDWILKTHYFDMTTAATTVSLIAKAGATVYYDDIMLRPIASSATGYVYNEWDELISIVGNNGLATRFEYDKAGRLVKTYVEVFDDQPNGLTGGFKLSSENKMKYKYL